MAHVTMTTAICFTGAHTSVHVQALSWTVYLFLSGYVTTNTVLWEIFIIINYFCLQSLVEYGTARVECLVILFL